MYPKPMVFVQPLLLLAAISVGLAHFVWRRSRDPRRTWAVFLMLAVAGWLVGYAFELASPSLSARIFWAKVTYLPIVMVPFTWLAFVLRYTGREKWLTGRNLALLAIEPLVTLVLVWTTELHGLLYSSMRLDPTGSFLTVGFGPWFWVDMAYSYLLLAASFVMLLRQFLRSSHPRRAQAGVLLIGASIPWAAEVLSLSGLNPVPYLDLTPFSFMFAGLAMVWGLTRFELFGVVSAARDVVMESMSDGLIVLDTHGQVVDMNPAAKRIIGHTKGGADELVPPQVLFARPDLIVDRQGATGTHSEIVLSDGEKQRYYDLRILPLHSRRGRILGQLIHLTDISEHREAEEERDNLIAQLQEALAQVRALQGLLPICASCKRIRNYAGRWRQMEEYVSSHSATEFTHGLCPDCRKRLYPDFDED